MLSRESIVQVGSGGPMADVRVTGRRAPTSRWRVVVQASSVNYCDNRWADSDEGEVRHGSAERLDAAK